MKKNIKDSVFLPTAVILIVGAFLWGGRGVGAVASGAGYDIKAERHMSRLEEDLRGGKITRQAYDIRKDQIRNGSLLK